VPPRHEKEEPKEEEWEHIPLAKLSRHPNDPEDAPDLSLTIAHLLAGAGGAAGGAPGGQPIFDISDNDEDVKPDVKLDVKMEDGDAGSSSGGRRRGGRGRYGGR
jgi:hypothetical protein